MKSDDSVEEEQTLNKTADPFQVEDPEECDACNI